MEKRALAPSNPQILTYLDTSNFWSFLLDKANHPKAGFRTAEIFSLPELKPGLVEMYAAARVDFVHDEVTRLRARQAAEEAVRQTIDPSNEYFQRRLDRELRRVEQQYGKKEEMERFRNVHFNPFDNTYNFGPIYEGEAYKSSSDIFDVLEEGKEPLLEIHTHPRNSLPSPSDYARMIMGKNPDTRVLKGGLLLTPDFQILSIATPRTPIMASKTALRLVELYEDTDNEDHQRNKWLSRWYFLVPEISKRLTTKALSEGFAKMMDFVEELGDQGLSEQEIVKRALLFEKEVDAEVDQKLDVIYKKNERTGERVGLKLDSHLRASENRDCWEFARAIDVQLYLSTDMTNYRAFN